MIRYAVFMEPGGPLRDFVVDEKRRVEECLPGQTYCAHPPHGTLIVASCEQGADLESALQRALRDVQALDVKTTGMHPFYDDAMAGGGHTVVVKAGLSPSLGALQFAVAEALRPFLVETENDPAQAIDWAGPFRESLDRYGFPFVGPHWMPHFSIASLKVPRGDSFLCELLAQPAEFEFRLDQVSLWRIDGDSHQKVGSYPLRAE
ncbi:MAG: 2'-5' RNA ligase family protein [Verrucomicrobia bacterium]|nr:2'-5' RNA ligase family protein [Verrucomicrobiota bacterium]MDA1086704.1 2'-5' RNA ligase family protein [Verrucomicrobiota bacterium]